MAGKEIIMPANMREDTVIFEIREHLGVIAKKKNGWSRELNLVCWNNQEPPKFDVRDWSRDHKHMSRGITMYSDEMRRLFTLYMDWNNQIVVEKSQEQKRRNSEEYYQQRDAIRERFSSEQKVVPDVEEEEWESRSTAAAQAASVPEAASAPEAPAEQTARIGVEAAADTQAASAGEDSSDAYTGEASQHVTEDAPQHVTEEEASPSGKESQEEVPEDVHPEAFATPAAEAAEADALF